MARSEIHQDKCRCGNYKDKQWHLACPDCWAKIPPDLQDEVYASYKEKRGSPRHISAIRLCYEHLRQIDPVTDNTHTPIIRDDWS